MAPEAVPEVLVHARALEERDAALAHELATLKGLSEEVAALRARALDLSVELAQLPCQRVQLVELRDVAMAELGETETELAAAESRLAELAGSRRRREDERERAEKELATAREARADARTRVARLEAQEAELTRLEERLVAESHELVGVAGKLAVRIGTLASVAESTTRPPGAGVEGLDEWAGQARSALFVARGTLEQDRERIVAEANALGSAVLGEQLGGSSASLVRRRLETALG